MFNFITRQGTSVKLISFVNFKTAFVLMKRPNDCNYIKNILVKKLSPFEQEKVSKLFSVLLHLVENIVAIPSCSYVT
jgi:hypothetical protein